MTKRAVDPEKIFLHAVAFHYAWKILRTEMMKGPPVEANALAPPFGMLSAFTSELLLKCIICIEKGHSPRQHDLKVLFDMLSVQTRRRLEQIWVEHIAAAGDRLAEMERTTGVTYARDLSAALSACGKTFAKVRYGYEGEERFSFYLTTLPDMFKRVAFELRLDWAKRAEKAWHELTNRK